MLNKSFISIWRQIANILNTLYEKISFRTRSFYKADMFREPTWAANDYYFYRRNLLKENTSVSVSFHVFVNSLKYIILIFIFVCFVSTANRTQAIVYNSEIRQFNLDINHSCFGSAFFICMSFFSTL